MDRKIPLCKFCGDPIAPEGLDRVLLLQILALWGIIQGVHCYKMIY